MTKINKINIKKTLEKDKYVNANAESLVMWIYFKILKSVLFVCIRKRQN